MTSDIDPHDLVRDVATRGAAAVGLAGIALIHLLDSIGKWSETRYLFWMYVAPDGRQPRGRRAPSCTRAAAIVWLAAGGSPRARSPASSSAGRPACRTRTGDIGNWTEPLGLASLFVEGAVLAVSAYALATCGRSVCSSGARISLPGAR